MKTGELKKGEILVRFDEGEWLVECEQDDPEPCSSLLEAIESAQDKVMWMINEEGYKKVNIEIKND